VIPAYVGIGSNQGDARAHVLAAFDELAQLPATHLAARSSLYRSAPVDAPGQPDYVNAVAALDTELSPAQLLDALQGIEQRHGRERPHANAPRTLDLDLLTYGDMILESPMLTLPHPRMHQRAFVLRPLAEIAPALRIPGRGAVAALLAGVADQAIARL
jgi:2-amino-4-hydroxy-6-hydroxymethyldihydropteridine diphosphokinase